MPLVVEERSSASVEHLLVEDDDIVAWWATPVECASAVARRERSGAMELEEAAHALARLRDLASGWAEVPAGERLRNLSIRLVQVHELRASDALQLAAALTASESHPETLAFVTLDDRLAAAARREGFPVLP